MKTDEDLNSTLQYGASNESSNRGGELGEVLTAVRDISDRLSRLELEAAGKTHRLQQRSPYQAQNRSGVDPDTELGARSLGPDPFNSRDSAESPELVEVQELFNSVKSSVDKVLLPPSLKLHDSRSGIKKEDQPSLNIISKCGRYIETALKVVSEFEENKPVDLEPLLITLKANIKYLQDEYAALLVKGRFDNQTAQLFRSLQRNNSGFDEKNLQNVRVAAELSSIRASQVSPSYNYSTPYNYSTRPRFYNSFRGNFQQRSRGYFPAFRGQGGPRFRPPFSGNQNFQDPNDI